MNSNSAPPAGGPIGPCWYCVHWGGACCGNVHGICLRPGAQCVKASPETGCAFWTREPGVDDDLWVLPPEIFPTPKG